MFLFIFESIGTSELILIGIIALIFLGPRKLPQIAKTLGKTLNDFRNTTNEFKSTWEREVNFEEEAKAIRTGELSDMAIARVTPLGEDEDSSVSAPEVKEIEKAEFDEIAGVKASEQDDPLLQVTSEDEAGEEGTSEKSSLSDKRNWL